MKKIVMAVILLCSTMLAQAQVTKAKLVASGLTCSMCSRAIYEALQKIKSIETVKANIKESSYTISFKKDVAVSPDELKKAVEDAGFFVARLQLTMQFNEVAVKNDEHISTAGINLHFLNVTPQTLSGEKTVTILDNNFVTAKERKKYAVYTTMKCFTTGIMENCCSHGDAMQGQRIYHVTIGA